MTPLSPAINFRTVPQQAATFSVAGSGLKCVVQYQAKRGNDRLTLDIDLVASSPSDKTTTAYSYTYLERSMVKAEYFIAARARGSAEPLLIARVRRPNWLDDVAYDADPDDVHKAFSFSSRDPGAVQWIAKNGCLTAVRTYDEFEPLPRELASRERNGWRWLLRTDFVWSAGQKRFVPTRRGWERYRFGSPLPATRALLDLGVLWNRE